MIKYIIIIVLAYGFIKNCHAQKNQHYDNRISVTRDVGSQFLTGLVTSPNDTILIEHDFDCFISTYNLKRSKYSLSDVKYINNQIYKNSKYETITNPAINWIKECYQSRSTLEYNSNYDFFCRFSPKWIKQRPVSFINEFTIDVLDSMYQVTNYLGFNHQESRKVDSLNKVNMFITNHGVFIEREEKYMWIFINDCCATYGSVKLRDSSISKAYFSDNNQIVVERKTRNGTVEKFEINFESGICNRIRK